MVNQLFQWAMASSSQSVKFTRPGFMDFLRIQWDQRCLKKGTRNRLSLENVMVISWVFFEYTGIIWDNV